MKYLKILFFCLWASATMAQTEEDTKPIPEFKKSTKKSKFDLKNLYVGGNIGGGWNGQSASFLISPVISYRVKPWLEPGIGALYSYYQYPFYNGVAKQNTYGGTALLRAYPWEFLYLGVEGFVNQYNWEAQNTPYPSQKFILGNVIASGGYRYAISDNAYAGIGLSMNLIPNKMYQYTYIPQLHTYIGFGLRNK